MGKTKQVFMDMREKEYHVFWWQETNDISTDYDERVKAKSEEEAIKTVKEKYKLARKISCNKI